VFVAKRLGITAPYLCSVKRGKRPLSPRLASRFEEVFGIGADWLLTAEGDMIVDVAKACRHMDLGPPDIAFSGSYGRPGAFEVVRNMLLWPGRTSRRASSTAVPVLEAPPDGRPEASKHFRGAYARLPDPYVGELYCLPADGGYEPVFRSGEFVLVQNIGDPQLEPEDVDGRVCVARTNEDGPWELLGLRVVGQRGDVQVEGTPVTRRGAERTTVRWEQLRIAGVVVMAFRTVFEMP
jgi:transcriptional regulator with XRE-family HTH domain